MAVTIHEPKRVAESTWLVVWESTLDSPTYRVFRDGELVDESGSNNMLFVVPAGGSLVIEVRDDDGMPDATAESYATLAWDHVSEAHRYRIEEYNGSWSPIATVPARLTSYTYKLHGLPGSTQRSFRVVPVNAATNDGTPTQVDVVIAKVPAPPVVNFAFDRDLNQLTISAA